MKLWPFTTRPAPPADPVADAARTMVAKRKRNDRAPIRALAREMRAKRGLPEDPALRDR